MFGTREIFVSLKVIDICTYDTMEKLQPPWFVDLLRSVLPEPNQDGEVQGETVDDGGLPQVKNVGDLLLCNHIQSYAMFM